MKRALLPATLSAILLSVLLWLVALGAGEPPPATPVRVLTYTFMPTTVLSNEVAYTEPALTVQNVDPAQTTPWNAAEVFIDATFGPTATLTATVEMAPDSEMFADAYFTVVDSEDELVQHTYTVVMDADGVSYLRVPIVGERMRVRLEALNQLTATVKVTYRNN